MDFDVLFIGSGQGAYNGAIPMSQAGLKVAVAEEGRFGGVCTNRGCNAKITLDRPVEILRQVEQLQEKGFNGAPILNWEDLMAHKHEVIDGLSESNRMKLVNAGVTILTGHAKFVDDHTVSIDGHHYSSTKIVIVSGQHPHQMEIPGSELFHDSTDFLVTEHLPAKMAIIGGGYVAMESATIANAFGCDVTVILRGTKVLRGFYQPYVQKIISDLQSRGVKFNFSESIEQARQTTAGIQLNGTDGYQLTADYVLDASGRRPNVQNMDLDRIGLKFDEATGIEVDDHLQTNVPGIYATGDVIQKTVPKITPTAIFESLYLSHLFKQETTAAINYPAIPHTVFTSPRIAAVGVEVAEAKAHPEKYHIVEFDYATDWFRQVGNETNGGITIVYDADNIVVGAVSYGNDAVETINGLTDIIENKTSHEDVERLLYIFPSIAHSYMRKV